MNHIAEHRMTLDFANDARKGLRSQFKIKYGRLLAQEPSEFESVKGYILDVALGVVIDAGYAALFAELVALRFMRCPHFGGKSGMR